MRPGRVAATHSRRDLLDARVFSATTGAILSRLTAGRAHLALFRADADPGSNSNGEEPGPVRNLRVGFGLRKQRSERSERGAVLVEFAIVLPLLLGLVFGMVSFGFWYNTKLNLSTAAREGARYGATLPLSGYATTNAWLDAVATATVGAAGGQLGSSVASRYTCVALIDTSGTTRRIDSAGSVSYSTGTSCYADSLGSQSRVQVVAQRSGTINAVLFNTSVTSSGRAVARFEASAS
jgi:Flp pilus assembly protein TadG